MKRILFFATLLPAALYSQAAIAETSTVELDRLDIISGKERNFSLPLDSLPATGSRLGLSNRDLPASVSVISQEMMQLRGFRTAVEAVEGAVGMTGGTQYGSIPGYATRGFTANSVTILRDGIRQNTGSQASRTIDSFLLDRVEVLKGPASLLFGEGAIGGAVNYLSKPPTRTPRGEVLFSAGSWDSYRLGIGAGGPLKAGKVYYRADASFSETAGYVDAHRQRYTGLAGALGWDVTPDLKLTFYTTYLDDSNQSYYGNPVIYDAVDRLDPATGQFTRVVDRANAATDRLVNPRVEAAARKTNYNISDNYAESENTFHRLRADWDPKGDWSLRNEAYVATQLLKWRNLESNLWNPLTRMVDRTEFVHIYRDDVLVGNRVDATWRGSLLGRPSQLLIGGYAERNDLVRGSKPTSYPASLSSVSLLDPVVGEGPGNDDRAFLKTARVTIDTAALYVENATDITGRIKLVSGLRYDDIEVSRRTLTTGALFGKSYAPITGRAGVVWSVVPEVNVYASYSRAAEPVTQLTSVNTAQADFSLQTGRQYEIGAKGTFLSDKLDFTVALFDIEKNDMLSSTLDPNTGVRINQQIGAQVSQGGEVALAFSPTREWRIETNAAWTWKARYQDFYENVGTGVVSRSGNTPPNVPEWVLSAYVSRTFLQYWRVGSGVRHVDRRAANNANLIHTPAYTNVDFTVGYSRDRWSVTLHVRNLLDESYEEWATGNGLMQRLADPRSIECAFHATF